MDYMNYFNNKYVKYLFYVLKHKYYVFKYGLKFKVPIINLIIHDWDKFLPSMIVSYTNYFYNKENKKGYLHQPMDNDQFDLSWLQHIHYNKHHWQHWILQNDTDGLKVLKMPEVDCLEMIADWYGAAEAQDNPYVKGWYLKHYQDIKLHTETRNFVNQHFDIELIDISTVKLDGAFIQKNNGNMMY